MREGETMEELIRRIKKEIEQLESDSECVENLVSRSVLEYAIQKRRLKLEELKNR
jgi:hypothetical protein